jgi:hypothetical protein
VPGGDVTEHVIDQMGTVKAMWEKRVASLMLATSCILYTEHWGNSRHCCIITSRHKADTNEVSLWSTQNTAISFAGNSKEYIYIERAILNTAHSSRLRLYLVNMWHNKYCNVHLFLRRILISLDEKCTQIFSVKCEWMTSLRRSSHRSEDNNKSGFTEIYIMNKHNGRMDLKEILGLWDRDWFYLAKDTELLTMVIAGEFEIDGTTVKFLKSYFHGHSYMWLTTMFLRFSLDGWTSCS